MATRRSVSHLSLHQVQDLPGLVRGRHRNDTFFHVTIDHVCLEIDIQYAVNVKTDVDGSDPIETERLEDLRLG